MQLSFPSVSPFLELVQQAERSPGKIILRDHSSSKTATAGELLQSVSSLRNTLHSTLLENDLYDSRNGREDKFIFLLAPPGLEYVVSMLTIFSLGAAMSAQSIVIRPEEIKRYFKLSKPLALLYSATLADKVEGIKSLCAESDSGVDPRLLFVEIEATYPASSKPLSFQVESATGQEHSWFGSLFFTSGTSGNQKGVVHSYQALLASARERIGTWKLTENDVVLNQKPGNWMGGIFGIIPTLMSGACLEICAGVFSPEWFWERISQGGVSIFDIAPTGYDRLAQYFDEHISGLPSAQREIFVQGIIDTRVAGVSGSLLLPHTQRRWTELRRGKPLLNLYGSTEVTLICSMRWENPDYLDMCCVGPAVPGVEVKLVDGEVRLKAPSMFSRYISDDPTLTEKAFDSEGFFRSGDCAEKHGDAYVLHAEQISTVLRPSPTTWDNISINRYVVLHFWGFTLHAGEIENALLSLPYIANAIVLPLNDDEFQERAAAILQPKATSRSGHPTLDTLRRDLAEQTGLLLFKQPTVVYWLRDGEEIPLTANGKVSKRDARTKFFGDNWRDQEKIEVLDLKGMEYWRMGGQC